MFTPVVFMSKSDVLTVWVKPNIMSMRYIHCWEDKEEFFQYFSNYYHAVRLPNLVSFFDMEKVEKSIVKKLSEEDYWVTVEVNPKSLILEIIQFDAKEELRLYSQDTHSPEFKEWLEDRATFYNNGFYEYAQENNIRTKDVKVVSDVINGRYEELYTCSEHKGERYSGVYSEQNSNFTIAKYNGKIVVFGTGTDECGSDWMNFCIFHVYDKLEDVVAINRATVHAKKANGTDVTKLHEFCALYNKTL